MKINFDAVSVAILFQFLLKYPLLKTKDLSMYLGAVPAALFSNIRC